MPVICEWCSKLIAPTKVLTINLNGITKYICADCKAKLPENQVIIKW